MSPDVRQETLTYLHQHHVMTLATTGVDGVWAAAVFYVNDGFTLYFLSAAHTRHGQHIALNPKVAATIQEDYEAWPDIRGIQLEGHVTLLKGEARRAAQRRFQTKYPFIADGTAAIEAALAKVSWYCLEPIRLYFIDNSKGFGHRDEIVL